MKRWIVFSVLILSACQPEKKSPAAQNTAIVPSAIASAAMENTLTSPPAGTEEQGGEEIQPVNIPAFCTIVGKPKTVVVDFGTPINIVWGWNAKTEKQINDFLANNITTITLDGKPITGEQKGGIFEKNGFQEVVWLSPVGILEPGDHLITYDVKWKKMIEDGTSTYGPGGKNETEHDECVITIE